MNKAQKLLNEVDKEKDNQDYSALSKAKVISMSAKCSDLFGANILDAEGKELATYDGYVPAFFPDQHYGDYVMLDIELSTGKILNWKKVSTAALTAAIKKDGKMV